MTVRVYRSSDTSAPVLNATAGSMITVLDAVLVNGYGSKTALGWTKPFSGTNTASYKQPAGTTNGFYLDVNDANPNADTNKSARVLGYEAMTAVATGTNPFPTVAQKSTAVQWVKSTETVVATPVSWVIVGTNKFFFMWVKKVSTDVGSPGGDIGALQGFGDVLSYKTADAYNTMICGVSTASNPATAAELQLVTSNISLTASIPGTFMTRSYTQTGTAVAIGQHCDAHKLSTSAGAFGYSNASQALPYPNGPDTSLYTSSIWVHEASIRELRGIIPGIYAILHDRPLTTGNTFTGGVGTPLAGKTLEVFSCGYSTGAGGYGQILLETSDTW